MSKGLALPESINATATRFCGGSAVGVTPPTPCYQIDGARGSDRQIVFTEGEAEIICKAILKDIRESKAAKRSKRCERCRLLKPDAHRRPDDYAREINGDEKATWVACDACDQENRDDI